jgi:Na+-translocating ferredoxin:NAD+ oxidoreductase subunit B
MPIGTVPESLAPRMTPDVSMNSPATQDNAATVTVLGTTNAEHAKNGNLSEKIDALLPQTQCQRCGYQGCKPYAEAITRNEADINQCPPGGAAGIHRLATLLGREFIPLSSAHGIEQPKQIAVINENTCIGCTLCIQACPVDAIVGASKLMHTVITDQCTGCELCIPPCPVDCIDLVSTAEMDKSQSSANRYDMTAEEKAAADAARQRYEFRQFRLVREQHERDVRLATIAKKTRQTEGGISDPKQALIAAALERARKNAQTQNE